MNHYEPFRAVRDERGLTRRADVTYISRPCQPGEVHHVEFWHNRKAQSWVVQRFDKEDNQIGDADYVGTVDEAVTIARRYVVECRPGRALDNPDQIRNTYRIHRGTLMIRESVRLTAIDHNTTPAAVARLLGFNPMSLGFEP